MCCPWALARLLPSAVRVRIRSRSTSAKPPSTASIKRPVLVPVSAHGSGPAMLRTAFYAMKRDAAPGVDGMTWKTYEEDLDRRIETLHARVQAGTYRALPSRRSYIPKEDGSKRPLAVAALEDKIVQRAVAAGLSAIHEEDFHGTGKQHYQITWLQKRGEMMRITQ